MSWKDKMYCVLYTNKPGNPHKAGQVAKFQWLAADGLRERGFATFISRTLYKAAKAGINIAELKNLDEKKLKAMIAEINKKTVEKQEKSDKKRQRQRRGKEETVATK